MPAATTVPNVSVSSGRERQRARAGVAATFVANGLLIGSWAPRIPEVKAHLGLSAGALDDALLAPALGTVLSARTVGARNARHGSAVVPPTPRRSNPVSRRRPGWPSSRAPPSGSAGTAGSAAESGAVLDDPVSVESGTKNESMSTTHCRC